MSGIELNVDFTSTAKPVCEDTGTRSAGNKKHQQFIKRRRFLERRGLLHSKHKPWKELRKSEGERSCPAKSQDEKSKVNYRLTDTTSVPNPSASQTAVKSASPHSCSKIFKGSSVAVQFKNVNSITTVSQAGNSLSDLGSHAHIKDNLFGNPLKYVALDCEMVGTGPKGRCSEVARCSIVTYNGDIVYDKYILPTSRVTDYRTRWSGIQPRHLQTATPFVKARSEIVKILSGMVVVGHSIHNDFKALHYSHPPPLTRDTSCIPLLNRKGGFPEKQIVSLKKLTKALLKQDIQTGKKGHSSVEDARASMELYRLVEVEWEKVLALQHQVEAS